MIETNENPIVVIDELQEIRRNRQKIDGYTNRIIRLRSAVEGVTCHYVEGSKGTAVHDTMAAQVSKAIDMEAELLALIVAIEERIRGIEEYVETLPCSQALTIRLRYIEGLRWKDVAARSTYDIRWCQRLHDTAMENMKGVTITRHRKPC